MAFKSGAACDMCDSIMPFYRCKSISPFWHTMHSICHRSWVLYGFPDCSLKNIHHCWFLLWRIQTKTSPHLPLSYHFQWYSKPYPEIDLLVPLPLPHYHHRSIELVWARIPIGISTIHWRTQFCDSHSSNLFENRLAWNWNLIVAFGVNCIYLAAFQLLVLYPINIPYGIAHKIGWLLYTVVLCKNPN